MGSAEGEILTQAEKVHYIQDELQGQPMGMFHMRGGGRVLTHSTGLHVMLHNRKVYQLKT